MTTLFKIGLITTMGLTATYLIGKPHPSRIEIGLIIALGFFIVFSVFLIHDEKKIAIEEEEDEEMDSIEETMTEDSYLTSFRSATNEGMLPVASIQRNYVREDAYAASLGGY